MRPRQGMLVKSLASGIVLALLLHPFASAQEAGPPQATTSQSQTGNPRPPQPDVADTVEPPSENQSSGIQIPDSPGTVQANANKPQATIMSSRRADVSPTSDTEPARSQQSDSANAPPALEAQASSQSNNPFPDQPSQASMQPPAQSPPQPQPPHEPVGTAAAESVQTTGVAAFRPAGAAAAPAKQRRARSILIKVGALVGVGVAVGTTMALSQGSPSKPPGSH
jgi:cell division protein FtsN